MKDKFITHLYESMNALTSGFMPGFDQSECYIVNYMQNNVFAQGLTDDIKLRHMITVDPKDHKLKDIDTSKEYGFDNSTDIKGVYRVLDKANLSEALNIIKEAMDKGNTVEDDFIFSTIFGHKMYSFDQIEFEESLPIKKVVPFEEAMEYMNTTIRNNILYGSRQSELMNKIKYGNESISQLIQENSDILKESSSFTEELNKLRESEDKSRLDPNHKRGMNRAAVKTIDLYDDECYKYFDKKEIDYYRKDNRKGEILVETEYPSAIGYIYVSYKNNNVNEVGPFKVFDAYKGKGFGQELLEDAINKYKANTIVVYKDNEVAIELYKKVGFNIVENIKKNNEDAYLMKL